VATLSSDVIRTSIDSALQSINEVLLELKRWPGKPRFTNERKFYERNKYALAGLRECLVIESPMLTSAQDNLESPSLKDSKQRNQFSIDQYVLFEIIDKAAREEKTAIAKRESWPRANDVARRSLYLHYRVVNVIKQSPRLRRLYGGHVDDLRKTLEAHRGEYEIFVAHASADKPLVRRVLSAFRARGKQALKEIKREMKAYPGNAKRIEAVFKLEQEKLDLLNLGAWYDTERLVAGDNDSATIDPTIDHANTLLVFFTPSYEKGWYLRNKEIPKIKRRLADADREEVVANALAKRTVDGGLRAIPVILAPEVWEKRREKDWVKNWRATVTCPENLTSLKLKAKGRRLTPEELIPAVVSSLTGDQFLKRITGGLAEKSPLRRNL